MISRGFFVVDIHPCQKKKSGFFSAPGEVNTIELCSAAALNLYTDVDVQGFALPKVLLPRPGYDLVDLISIHRIEYMYTVYICDCMHIYIYLYISLVWCVYIYIQTYTIMYIYIHIYIYTHMYLHWCEHVIYILPWYSQFPDHPGSSPARFSLVSCHRSWVNTYCSWISELNMSCWTSNGSV